MIETVVDNTPEVVMIKPNKGFATRSALEEKIAKDEEELKTLVERNTKAETQEDKEGDDPNLPPEESTFKKRYGDLRRHSQKQQAELQKQIDDLRTQLEQSTKKQIKLPKTEAELEEWAKEYPDVAKIVETIAIKKAKEQSFVLEERMKKIDQMQYQAEKEKAEAELMRLHTDFDVIRDTEEFHNWVEVQPKWIQQALYENETDAASAARAIDLYKSDAGITEKKKRSQRDMDKDVARNVISSRGSSPDKNGEGNVLRESEVEKMSAKEYEVRQEEIVAAIRAGRFVYDLSGPAR